ncbi:MAG: magnesium/cobalt transporter CorA [Anaerolineae bacterium]|nr:magnesium/cobalt transporter CorA [Phycisphaerae bacterium]
MLKAFIRWGDGKISRDTDAQTIARALEDEEAMFWLDMQNPNDEEVKLLNDVFHFHPLAIEDSLKYAQRPKIEDYSHRDTNCPYSYYYMVFHGPDLKTFREKLRTKEIDMFFAERFLVTHHDEEFVSINEVIARGEADPQLLLKQGLDMLLYQILDRITDHYQPILDYLELALDELEEEALDRPKPEILQRIAAKKRELLDLRRTVGPQREVVAQLARGEVPFIRESARLYFRDVQDHLIRVVEMVELYRDLVLGARDIYLSSISNHLNQIMKTLTIFSVIGLPLTVITGFFGMNFDAIPGLHSPRGFWGAVAFMAFAVTFLLWLFWKKKWI